MSDRHSAITVAGILLATAAATASCSQQETPTGMTAVRGTQYSFALPADTAFVETRSFKGDRLIRTWTHEVSPGGLSCEVVVAESTHDMGNFAADLVAAFGAYQHNGGDVVANEEFEAPAGTKSAVRQEMTYEGGRDRRVQFRRHQRHYLTPDNQWLSIRADGPVAEPSCRTEDITESFRVARSAHQR